MGFNLGKSLKKVAGGVGKFLFGGGGPENPYNAVDFNALMKMDLEAPGNAYDYNKSFQDLLGVINAPSSTEGVLKEVEGQRMQDLLTGVDREVDQSVGGLKSDFLDRGLGGPAQMSDMEAVGLAQARGSGAEAKGRIRGEYATQELNRLLGKEQALQSAYGQKYTDTTSMAEAARQRNLQRLLGLTGQQVNAYAGGVDANQKYGAPGFFQDTFTSFGKSFGTQLGKKAGGG